MRNTVVKRLRKEAALLSKTSGSYSILNVIYQDLKKAYVRG